MFQPHCAFTPPASPRPGQPFRRLPTGLSRRKVEPLPPPDAPHSALRRNAAAAPLQPQPPAPRKGTFFRSSSARSLPPAIPPIIYSTRAQERIIFFMRAAVNPPFILTFAVCNQNDGGAQMTNTIRPIPYGVADFLSLRERNMYFQHLLLPTARRVHPGLPGGLSRRDGGGVFALRRVDL